MTENRARTADNPIAIVGVGALFPGASNAAEYWENIVTGRDCITDVPEDHWRLEDYYDADPAAPDKTYCKRGGFIPEVPFSPIEFGLPPNSLEVTDVLQLLSLGVARDTLADAGAPGSAWYKPERTGVILGITGANSILQPLISRLQTPVLKEVVRSVGLSDRDADEIATRFAAKYAPWEENSFPGMLGNVVAGRIANRFDLGGTNCTVDAACASSLAALHMAIAELNSGRADMMLTGGCDAENTILMYMCFSKTPALSKTGNIRPFDENADGTLIGEGTGMIAIKRLADAERDGDRVYAVIRGIGSSSDGKFKSIYAPRAAGQVKALRAAYRDAGVEPSDIGLLECHGTGTKVGDRTELTALEEVFSGVRGNIAVGSVKSQIGHTKAAAGAASLIKTAFALHNKVLPPTINVETIRTDVDFDNGPFYVNTQARPWTSVQGNRIAGVSAFGFGGTNFHVILEEHVPATPVSDSTVADPVAVVRAWHAPTADQLLAALDGAPADLSRDIPAGHARLTLAAASAAGVDRLLAEARKQLTTTGGVEAFQIRSDVWYAPAARVPGKIAGVFSGQGSQYVGMARTAATQFPAVREGISAAARGYGQPSISDVVFPPPVLVAEKKAVQEQTLTRTENAQRAIGAVTAGHLAYLSQLGLRLEGVLGHSYGELSALYAAGALSEADYFRLTAARGDAMKPVAGATDAGSMAAISADAATVAQLLAGDDDVTVSNNNGPSQIVVGGSTPGIDAVVALAGERGIRARKLPVSAAFHTRFVAHARDVFSAAVSRATVSAPRVPVFANTPGAAYGVDPVENARVLSEQLVRPVDFHPQVAAMYEAGYRVFVEFGPGRVLTGLVNAVLVGRPDVVAISIDGGAKADGALSMQRAIAQLLALGLPLHNPRTRTTREQAPAKKGTLMLNGLNIMPEARRERYEGLLDNGYRVEVAQSAPAAAVPEPAPEHPRPATRPAVHVMPARRAVVTSTIPTNEAAGTRQKAKPVESQQLHAPLPGTDVLAHSRYIDSQVAIGQRLVDLLDRESHLGRVDAQLVSAVQAITHHTAAVGHAHAHASTALRDLVALVDYTPGQSNRMLVTPQQAPVQALTQTPAQPVAPVAPVTPVTPAAPVVPATPAAAAPTVVARFDTVAAPAAAPVAAAPAPAPVPAASAPVAAAPAAVAPVAVAPAAVASVAVAAAPAVAAGGVNPVVAQAVLAAVAAKTGYSEDMLDVSMSIEADLGVDSIKRVEIMGELRDQFPGASEVSPEQLGELDTLQDIVMLLSGAAAPAAPAAVAPVAVAPAAAPVAAPAVSAGGVNPVVAQAVLAAVAAKTGYSEDMLDVSMSIEADLGVDSIKRVEIMGELRDQFPGASEVSPEQLGELDTLEDIVNLLSGAAASNGGDVHPKASELSGISRLRAQLASLPMPIVTENCYGDSAHVVVTAQGTSARATAIAERLRAAGMRVTAVTGLTDPEASRDLTVIVTDDGHDFAGATKALERALLLTGTAVKSTAASGAGHRRGVVFVTALDGGQGYLSAGTIAGSGNSLAPAILGGIAGIAKTLKVEHPELFVRAIDVRPSLANNEVAELVCADVRDINTRTIEVGYPTATSRTTVDYQP